MYSAYLVLGGTVSVATVKGMGSSSAISIVLKGIQQIEAFTKRANTYEGIWGTVSVATVEGVGSSLRFSI
jgi:hypothetical protein